MSVEIRGRYAGNKKTILTHLPSGVEFATAAPLDNQGDGSSFSPTDMVAGALGACMLTLIAIVGERDGLDVSGTHFRVEKHMQASPRRIGRLPISVHLPVGLNTEARAKLERAALTCPVHHSLHPEIEIPVEFCYDV